MPIARLAQRFLESVFSEEEADAYVRVSDVGGGADAALSHVADVSESNSSQTKIQLTPSTDGVAEPLCEITILNDGSDTFWVTGDAAATQGVKLKPGQSITYKRHTSTDGDLALYPDTSNGLTAEIQYRE